MTEQRNKKYQFFLDETGDHGLTFIDDNFPIFLLAGCLFEDSDYQTVFPMFWSVWFFVPTIEIHRQPFLSL